MKRTHGSFPGWLGHRARQLGLALLVASLPLLVGCYGGFPATRTVYEFNGRVTDNRVVHSLLMWGMIIIPVYEIATLVDVFGLNVLEAVTRDPIIVRAMDEEGIEWVFERAEGGVAIVSRYKEGALIDQVRLTAEVGG